MRDKFCKGPTLFEAQVITEHKKCFFNSALHAQEDVVKDSQMLS